jgi:hypothetical protein
MLLLLLAAVAAEPVVEPIADGAFRISLPQAPGSIAAAQARLRPAAARSCAARIAAFARFRYTGTPPLTLEQELLCLPITTAPVPAAAIPDAQWSPDEVLQARLLAASYGYFAAKDAARYAEAYRLLAPQQQTLSPLPGWTAAATNFNAEAGPVRGRRVVEISWYNNPPDAPEPGIYVAADYSAEFDKLEFVCGYLMWRLQPDGSFRLVREEQNLVHKRGKPMAKIDSDPLRARIGCKD